MSVPVVGGCDIVLGGEGYDMKEFLISLLRLGIKPQISWL